MTKATHKLQCGCGCDVFIKCQKIIFYKNPTSILDKIKNAFDAFVPEYHYYCKVCGSKLTEDTTKIVEY